MAMFHASWRLFLPSAVEFQGAEGATGMIAGTIMLAFFPLGLSFTLQKAINVPNWDPRLAYYIGRRQSVQRIQAAAPLRSNLHETTDGPSKLDGVHPHSQRAFNDVKNRLFFALMRWHAPEPREKIGGSLHALHLRHPEYRQMPLFSCRAADCFVLCYTPDGQLEMQVRLSFIDCLDTRMDDPELAIPRCTSQHRASFATCSGEPCATFKPTKTTARVCIHSPLGGSKWMA
ncbi:hypothetical protein LEN26_017887 [Aphanomyces euteiches]|nr:hypothetical protein LEN26_017887 [Aphanomyces euteiches]